MKTEQWELDLIGKEVEASMDGETWFKGTLVKIIDLFVPYIVLTEAGEKGFTTIRGIREMECVKCHTIKHVNEFATPDECNECYVEC